MTKDSIHTMTFELTVPAWALTDMYNTPLRNRTDIDQVAGVAG